MGLEWSRPTTLAKDATRSVSRGPGVYQLSDEARGLVYVGQSLSLASRLRSHVEAMRGLTATFSVCVLPDGYTSTQLLEVENDLIGGFFEERRAAPPLQFRDRAEPPPQ
jgi:hypothetical protein